jgi:hypothetical protein
MSGKPAGAAGGVGPADTARPLFLFYVRLRLKTQACRDAASLPVPSRSGGLIEPPETIEFEK